MLNLFALSAAVALAVPAQQSAPDAAEAKPAADATEAVAPAEDAAEAEVVVAEKNDKDRIICKRTAIVGSKFKKRLCGTKEQWERMGRESADKTDEMQRRGKGLDPNGR